MHTKQKDFWEVIEGSRKDIFICSIKDSRYPIPGDSPEWSRLMRS
jgi:hypothetical protein